MKNLIYILGLLVLTLSSCDELFNDSGSEIYGGDILPSFLVIDAETYEDLLDPNTEGYYPHDSIAVHRIDGEEKIKVYMSIGQNKTASGDSTYGLYKMSLDDRSTDWNSDIGQTYTYQLRFGTDIDTLTTLLTEEKRLINFTYNGNEIPRTERDTAGGLVRYTLFK